jgi:hypothetical protein
MTTVLVGTGTRFYRQRLNYLYEYSNSQEEQVLYLVQATRGYLQGCSNFGTVNRTVHTECCMLKKVTVPGIH